MDDSRYWRDEAACWYSALPAKAWDLHWNDHPRAPSTEQRILNREARKVCTDCPVRAWCLEAAPREDPWGVTIRWTYFPKDVKYAASQRKATTVARTARHARTD